MSQSWNKFLVAVLAILIEIIVYFAVGLRCAVFYVAGCIAGMIVPLVILKFLKK